MDTLNRIGDKILFYINKLENQKLGLIAFVVVFFDLVFLRNFMEAYSTGSNYFSDYFSSFLFLHTPFFYLVSFLGAVLIAHFATGEKIEKVSKVFFIGFFLILLAPALDLAFSSVPLEMTYFPAFDYVDAWGCLEAVLKAPFLGNAGNSLLLEGEAANSQMASLNRGIIIELYLIGLLFLWYIFLKTKNAIKAFLGLIVFQFFIFMLSVFPYIFTLFLDQPHRPHSFDRVSLINPDFGWDRIIFSSFFILSLLLSAVWFFRAEKEKLLAFIRGLSFTRIGLALSMVVLGVLLSGIHDLEISIFDWLLFLTAFASAGLFSIAALVYNDVFDVKIDKVSNPSRPIARGKFLETEYLNLGHLLAFASLVSAFAVGYGFFAIMVFLFLGLPAYSYFPRLKKYFFLGIPWEALGMFLLALAGFSVNAANSIYDFPSEFVLFILVVFSLSFSFKDIKDYEGDKQEGIYTVPVVFGQDKGRVIIGTLLLLSFFSVPFILSDYFSSLVVLSAIAGILAFFFTVKKQFSEIPVFIIYFIYAFLFIFIVFL